MNLAAIILISWSVMTPALRLQRHFAGEKSIKSTGQSFKSLSDQVHTEDLEDGVLAFIPGMGNDDRTETIQENIAWLQRQGVPFECLIYKYKNMTKSDDAFKPCKVIEHEGQWMDHILQVPLNSTRKKYVLHMIDGVKLNKVDLRRMIHAMVDNDLVHAATALYGKFQYKQMAPHMGFGRFVNHIEPQFDLHTRSNFACLQDLAQPATATNRSNVGWGIDLIMPSVCKGNMGVIDVMKTSKMFVNSYSHAQAWQDRQHWAGEHHVQNMSKIQAEFEKTDPLWLGPLKGTVLKDDPQCDYTTKCWQVQGAKNKIG